MNKFLKITFDRVRSFLGALIGYKTQGEENTYISFSFHLFVFMEVSYIQVAGVSKQTWRGNYLLYASLLSVLPRRVEIKQPEKNWSKIRHNQTQTKK